jgi:hypothetical protein
MKMKPHRFRRLSRRFPPQRLDQRRSDLSRVGPSRAGLVPFGAIHLGWRRCQPRLSMKQNQIRSGLSSWTTGSESDLTRRKGMPSLGASYSDLAGYPRRLGVCWPSAWSCPGPKSEISRPSQGSTNSRNSLPPEAPPGDPRMFVARERWNHSRHRPKRPPRSVSLRTQRSR